MSEPARSGGAVDPSEPTRLRVALDLRGPFSYLALEPSTRLGRRRDVEIDWLPFAGHVLRPPGEAGPDAERGARHRRLRAEAIAREIEAYAEAAGLTIREPYRDATCDAAVRVWLWLRARRREALLPYLRALFRGYWACALDADDLDAVLALAALPDADAARAWVAAEGEAAQRAVQSELAEAGLVGPPAYELAGEVFWGRAHLPMLAWILDGRVGAGPI